MGRRSFTLGIAVGAAAYALYERFLKDDLQAQAQRRQTPEDLLRQEMRDDTLGESPDDLQPAEGPLRRVVVVAVDEGSETERAGEPPCDEQTVQDSERAVREKVESARKQVPHNPEAQEMPPIIGEE